MPKLAGLFPAGGVLLCLALEPVAVRADVPAPGAISGKDALTAVTHWLDPQDRLMSGHLSPAGETRSRAAALYAEALSNDPSGDRETTLAELRQVVALDPHFAEAQVALANNLLQTGHMNDALAQLTQAFAANPDSLSIESALAYTYRLHGQSEEAVQLAKNALSRDTSQSMAMRVLLEAADDQNDLAGAVVHIEDILKAAGSSAPAADWLTLARLYLEVARSAPAPPSGDVISRTRLPILQEAAAKSPDDVDTLASLGDTYRDLGRKPEALHELRKALDLVPSDVDLLMDCANLESDLGEKARALQDYETAYKLSPTLTGLRELLGRLDMDSGHFSEAIDLFRDARAQSPGDLGLLIDLGMAYEGANRPDDAQSCFQQVFSQVGCPPEAFLKLAFFQLARKDVRQAGETLAAAALKFPESAQIRYYQAVQHRFEKNYAAALACLSDVRRMCGLGSDYALGSDYYVETALTETLAGQSSQAEATLREGLGKFPDNPVLMNELAYSWADHDTNLKEALTLGRRAAQLAPENGAIQDTVGWTYFQMGTPKEALPYLQRAAVLTNNDPMVLQHVGDACLKLGKPREAVTVWRRALAQDPQNGDLATRIDAATAHANNVHSRPAPRP